LNQKLEHAKFDFEEGNGGTERYELFDSGAFLQTNLLENAHPETGDDITTIVQSSG